MRLSRSIAAAPELVELGLVDAGPELAELVLLVLLAGGRALLSLDAAPELVEPVELALVDAGPALAELVLLAGARAAIPSLWCRARAQGLAWGRGSICEGLPGSPRPVPALERSATTQS